MLFEKLNIFSFIKLKHAMNGCHYIEMEQIYIFLTNNVDVVISFISLKILITEIKSNWMMKNDLIVWYKKKKPNSSVDIIGRRCLEVFLLRICYNNIKISIVKVNYCCFWSTHKTLKKLLSLLNIYDRNNSINQVFFKKLIFLFLFLRSFMDFFLNKSI